MFFFNKKTKAILLIWDVCKKDEKFFQDERDKWKKWRIKGHYKNRLIIMYKWSHVGILSPTETKAEEVSLLATYQLPALLLWTSGQIEPHQHSRQHHISNVPFSWASVPCFWPSILYMFNVNFFFFPFIYFILSYFNNVFIQKIHHPHPLFCMT